MNGTLFSSKMKMVDLIRANHNIILLLPRFGIELGCGDRNVEEICSHYKVDVNLFLLICNVYSLPDFIPNVQQLKEADINGLVSYLYASHQYYLNERIPHIAKHLERLAESVGKSGVLVRKFFSDYKNEVVNHFAYEENIVFPYIKELIQGSNKAKSSYRIEQFEQNHTNIEDKLSDLTNIIIKYLPAGISQQEKSSVLFDLFQLAEDIDKHTLIEDKILAPFVELMEGAEK